jgi:hypothetical protein
MTSSQFDYFMRGFLDDGLSWSIEMTTKKIKNVAWGTPGHLNKYSLFIVNKDKKVIMKSDEQESHSKLSWYDQHYGIFVRTLKKV